MRTKVFLLLLIFLALGMEQGWPDQGTSLPTYFVIFHLSDGRTSRVIRIAQPSPSGDVERSDKQWEDLTTKADEAYAAHGFRPVDATPIHNYSAGANQPTRLQICGSYVLASLVGGPYVFPTEGAAWDVISAFGTDVSGLPYEPWDILVFYEGDPLPPGTPPRNTTIKHYALVETAPDGRPGIVVSKNNWERVYRGSAGPPSDNRNPRISTGLDPLTHVRAAIEERLNVRPLRVARYRLRWDTITVRKGPSISLDVQPTYPVKRGETLRGKLLMQIDLCGWSPAGGAGIEVSVQLFINPGQKRNTKMVSKTLTLDPLRAAHELDLERDLPIQPPDTLDPISLVAEAFFREDVVSGKGVVQRVFRSKPKEVSLDSPFVTVEVHVKDDATGKDLDGAKVQLKLEDGTVREGTTRGNGLPDPVWVALAQFDQVTPPPVGQRARYRIEAACGGYVDGVTEATVDTERFVLVNLRLKKATPALVLTGLRYGITQNGHFGSSDTRELEYFLGREGSVAAAASGHIAVSHAERWQEVFGNGHCLLNGGADFAFPVRVPLALKKGQSAPSNPSTTHLNYKDYEGTGEIRISAKITWDCAGYRTGRETLVGIGGSRITGVNEYGRGDFINGVKNITGEVLQKIKLWPDSYGKDKVVAKVAIRGREFRTIWILAEYEMDRPGIHPLPVTAPGRPPTTR